MSNAAYTTPSGDIASFMQRSDVDQFLAAPSRLRADWLDWSNHASALFVSGHTDLALLAARHALALERTPTTLLNLAVILESLSKFHPAFSLSAEAYELDPRDPFVAIQYSDALLRMGRFSEAWPIYADTHTNWKWVRKVIPEWDGTASLWNKRLLVLSGGGYGDTILFLRWMRRFKDMGARVTFMCPKSMHPLLERVTHIDHLIAGSVGGLEGMLIPRDYDFFANLLSLGGHFCPTSERIPVAPYIRASEAHSLFSRGGLRQCARHLIGVCTRAGEEKVPRRNRSLSIAQMHRLLSVRLPDDTKFVDLNYEWEMSTLDLLRPPIKDWADTATVLNTLDLVITVDTGVAHLAGALGKPCWVILSGASAAYYGVDGDCNSFYPSQRLFRNHAEGIDNSVDTACAALKERLCS